ncbi:UDP-N-acetylmuramoyl-L-alanine--D-glutamate ligase [Actinocrispum sp. NPDC049592]|uniref:UDP-N-acetylmuramoyl-L-alanine--D-glutamate ligase n=1 Tax=Actinocrispum sp. NPDC049592 TaxID=3154835 RepID=UPI003427A190
MGEFAGRNVLVAGAGVTGRSAVFALRELGANVSVTDGNPDALADFGPMAVTGIPDGTDLVVTSPGWKPSSPLLLAAVDAGIEVIGEVELAWRISRSLPDPPAWLAVTGTDGKTTTVGMLESILRAAGLKAVACGNVGLPVVDAVLAGHEVLAVELSSYQLHWQHSLRADAAVVLNLAEDHLDWHGTMDEYAAAKGEIYVGAKVRIANADDPWSLRLAGPGPITFTVTESPNADYSVADGWLVQNPEPPQDQPPPSRGATPVPVYRGGGAGGGVGGDLGTTGGGVDNSGVIRLCPVDEVRPPGPHNVSNALAAAALARAYGVEPEAVRDGLRAYQPSPHRVELVGEQDGVQFVNDSKATNTHAAEGSLTAFESIVWIGGGELRGAEVDDLVTKIKNRLRGVVLIGVDQDVFADAMRRHAPEVPVTRVGSGDDEPMTAAVHAARALARPGDVVLLAPAAKSFDMFRSYVHRGEAFTAAVQQALGT